MRNTTRGKNKKSTREKAHVKVEQEHDDGTSVSSLIAEVRKLRRLQLENNCLIDELRQQNQQLKQVLTENNSAIQRCIQKLEKTPQVEDSEVPGKDKALEVA